jgi:hypothetical protein
MPITPENVSLSKAEQIINPHILLWDPAPEWIRFDPKRLQEFGKFQIKTKMIELEHLKGKLEQLQRI